MDLKDSAADRVLRKNSIEQKLLRHIRINSELAIDNANFAKAEAIRASIPQAGQKQKKYAISAREAAMLIGVTTRTVQNWDKGQGKPIDYPGREDLTFLQMFAARQNAKKQQEEIARSMTMREAVSGGDIASDAMRKNDLDDTEE